VIKSVLDRVAGSPFTLFQFFRNWSTKKFIHNLKIGPWI